MTNRLWTELKHASIPQKTPLSNLQNANNDAEPVLKGLFNLFIVSFTVNMHILISMMIYNNPGLGTHLSRYDKHS